MNWIHPTNERPRTISLIGLGPTHHDYDQHWLNPNTPDAVWKVDEVWCINRGAFAIKHDLLFVMDHIQGEAEGYPVYGAQLWNHDAPIITSDNCDGWPAHVHRYPWAELWTWLNSLERPPKHMDWWHNSVAYILAYAAFIGVKTVRGWGLDYHHHKSGRVEDGHANVAYWTGVLEQVGMEVIPYGESTFLGANQRGWMYGYLRDPRPQAEAKRALFRRVAGIDPEPSLEDGPVSPQETI